MLFTALLQSQLVAYPATSHRLYPPPPRLPLFRDPGFLRGGSSTSARRTVKSQPLATSAEVPLLALALPSSRHPIIPVFFATAAAVLLLRRSRSSSFLARSSFLRGVNSRSRKIANKYRPQYHSDGLKGRNDANKRERGGETCKLLAARRTNNPERTSPSLPQDSLISFYLSSFFGTSLSFLFFVFFLFLS